MVTVPQRRILALVALVLLGLLAACGGGEEGAGIPTEPGGGPGDGRIVRNPDNADVQITVGSKNFTEQQVLGEIYAQGLSAAGYAVETDLDLGNEKRALAALERGRVDAYPEYTGTALLSFFDVPAESIPKDPAEAFERARDGFARRGLVAFPPTPFTSSNEVAVTQATAERLGLQKISDLETRAPELTLAGPPECRERMDCLLGLQQVYGLDFGTFMPVDIARRHEVLLDGEADVSIVFTTDPQLKRADFVLLEDDRGLFPPYNSTLVVREEVAERAGPDLARTVALLQKNLTDEAMQELNARVDIDGADPAAVAADYLRETGLVVDERP